MSMERHVFFHGKLPNKVLLARVMRELGFSFSIVEPRGSLERQSGFMPMKLKGEETGIEFDVFEGRAGIDELEPGDVDPLFDRSANFRWGGDENEMLVALCASAALAKLTNGIVFDDEEGKLFSVDEAIEVARQHYASLVEAATPKQPGTRPADIKRYLKPLLKQRDDLVLIGRMLFIRPVRHLLRGVFFDRTSDKYEFRIWYCLGPLYYGLYARAYCGYFDHTKVWESYFLPELLDKLDQEIFGPFGRVTSLTDFAEGRGLERPKNEEYRFDSEARVLAWLLAGERDRAIAYVDEMERQGAQPIHWLEEQRALLARDIESLCTEYHSREAAAAKALKLEGIWEPSPFPVELPAAERAAQTNETTFVTTPWIERPNWLLQDTPEKPGEIRFCKDYFMRNGRVVLLAALTREEAAQLHQSDQKYSFATRLENGNFLLFSRMPHWSPYDSIARIFGTRAPTGIHLWLRSAALSVRAYSDEDPKEKGTLHISAIDIRRGDSDERLRHCSFDGREGTKEILDFRSGETIKTQTKLSEKERELEFLPTPPFGEFTELLERIHELLRMIGYGELE